ncbi:DNA topoisomerase 2 [Trichuris trichiura]|uniref:DNA topoisomerase 2 n=1 Tax=Trichuris trichiura TaxID=36087 RepID=A0A077Z7T8_TRITR|nr:DNA topoisomerase 2 [Trichuris trichiura]
MNNAGMANSDVFIPLENFSGRQRREATIEETYQKKTQLEHVLIRPDTYIGSVELHREIMWVVDSNLDKMVQREITYVPGLYKIFDEILVNAADNKQRDPTMTCIKVTINQNTNEISVWNDGRGIPVVEHKVEKMYVPTLIFGTLLTSSNYDDSEKKVTGGRNGYGAKLCNIFSRKFTVETSCREYGKFFKQTWEDNMQKASNPTVVSCSQADYTCVKFIPDLAKFGMSALDNDIVALMSRRAYDVAGSTKGVKVYLNGKRLHVSGFRDYIDLYTKNRLDENQQPLKIVYEQCNPRWELAVTVSDKGFQQVSFVNSIATTKGGRHIDHALEGVVAKVVEVIKKDVKKSGFNVKPFQVKNHLWIFVNCLIENPTFDSQTKENMTLPVKSFGSKCTPSEKFLGQVVKCGILECVTQWLKFKNQLNSQCSNSKHSKLKGIPKLEDANEAGTKNSHSCTLILTEGDSAKTLAVSGFSVVGRDYYGVFPLKGKMLNVREATHAQICKNEEITNILKIIGLQYKRKYETVEELRSLRYGKVMIMADQDQDGSHIKGLVINFIHHNWPSLIRQNFLEEFITPIVKVSKGKEIKAFFSLPEYEEWKAQTHNWYSWKIKYYKGLGTSTAKEAKEYFSDMYRHRIRFHYAGNEDDCALDLAFSKKKVEDRKEWLSGWMIKRKRQRLDNIPEAYLYGKNTKAVSFKDFVDKELILFSNMDNERSIPSLVDGLKPGQRKVMFTCFKRNDKREVKVAQLAGSVAETSAYHHGEASLMGTIINLAHDFVGSNNVNLLLPVGQFGTRLQGGKDAASARYIFTMLNPVTRALFHESDIPCLNFLFDDNQRIEPEWYCPILPTVLINGAEGIGTGWSTKVPNYNPRELVDNIRRMLNNEEPNPMKPWYKNFRGVIEQVSPERFVCFGNVARISPNTIEITELPIGTWTQTYKESVLEPMLYGSELKQPLITDFKEYHTDTTVRFVVKVKPENMESVLQNVHAVFKLQSSISISSMVLFDAEGCLRRFENAEDILKEFYTVRLSMYAKRKAHLIGLLTAQAKRLENQARFVMEKIEGIIKIENMKKKVIVDQLIDRHYDPDPLHKWKQQQAKQASCETDEADTAEENSENIAADSESTRLSDFDYLLSMAVLKFSEEEKDKLLAERSQKFKELHDLKQKSPKDLWNEDLELFLSELDKQEKREREDAKMSFNENKAHWKQGSSVQQKQILPSENGVPLMPVVTQEFRQKAEKALQAKMRQRAIVSVLIFAHSSKSITDWISTGKPHDASKSRPIGSGKAASLPQSYSNKLLMFFAGIRRFLKPIDAVTDTELTNSGTSDSSADVVSGLPSNIIESMAVGVRRAAKVSNFQLSLVVEYLKYLFAVSWIRNVGSVQ